MAVKHGGNLLQIARQYQSDLSDWIDLSTGVSPFTYPLGEIPESVWNQLPQRDDGLESAAKRYYRGSTEPVAVAGSQAAIMSLPGILTDLLGRCGVVALPRVGYKEHESGWRRFLRNGDCWSIIYYDVMPTQMQVEQSDVVVIINPNNPTGKLLDKALLLKLQSALRAKNATLIVDEAFVDVTPENSLLLLADDPENLIVLRSLGKFFGLAGARVGFVFANQKTQKLLQASIGPWTVAGPARWAAEQALSDIRWQENTRAQIEQASERLVQLLASYLPFPMAGTPLFQTVYSKAAPTLHHRLCQEQVLTRLCDEKNAVRFGLPGSERQWTKLQAALIEISQSWKTD